MVNIVVTVLVLCLLVLWIASAFRKDIKVGQVRLQNGHVYTYVLGNSVPRGGGSTFRGIATTLPVALPHMYIDAHKGDYGRGVRYYIRRNQRLSLEGNFDTSFQVYVPKGLHVLALSVLTPDVMQVLTEVAKWYDVEIMGDTLRIISHQRIYNHPAREAAMLKALTALMKELDERIASWSLANEREAVSAFLKTEDNPSLKLGKRHIRLTTIVLGSMYGLLGLGVWMIVLSSWQHDRLLDRGGMVLNALVALAVFPGLWLYLVIGVPRGWLNWLGRLIDR